MNRIPEYGKVGFNTLLFQGIETDELRLDFYMITRTNIFFPQAAKKEKETDCGNKVSCTEKK